MPEETHTDTWRTSTSTSWLTYVSTVLKPLTDCVNVVPSCVDQQPTETTKVNQLKPTGHRPKEHLLTIWKPPVVTENECFPIPTLTGCSLALGEISWKEGATLKLIALITSRLLQAPLCLHERSQFICKLLPFHSVGAKLKKWKVNWKQKTLVQILL